MIARGKKKKMKNEIKITKKKKDSSPSRPPPRPPPPLLLLPFLFNKTTYPYDTYAMLIGYQLLSSFSFSFSFFLLLFFFPIDIVYFIAIYCTSLLSFVWFPWGGVGPCVCIYVSGLLYCLLASPFFPPRLCVSLSLSLSLSVCVCVCVCVCVTCRQLLLRLSDVQDMQTLQMLVIICVYVFTYYVCT